MGGKNIVKICSIAGFILAEIYMVYVVLAPYSPGTPGRMLVPVEMIPKEPDMPLGTQPPAKVTALRLVICAFFFGPLGAMVGCGVGLVLDGASRKFRKKENPAGKGPEAPSTAGPGNNAA